MIHNLIFLDSLEYVFPIIISLLLLSVFAQQLPNSYQACAAYLSTHLLCTHSLHCYPHKSHPHAQSWGDASLHWGHHIPGACMSFPWHHHGSELLLSLHPLRLACWSDWASYPLKDHVTDLSKECRVRKCLPLPTEGPLTRQEDDKMKGLSLSCLGYSPHWLAGERSRELDWSSLAATLAFIYYYSVCTCVY